MMKIVSLFMATQVGLAVGEQKWALGFAKKFEADTKLLKATLKISQGDIDATTSTNPKLRIRGSRSTAASYDVFVKKDEAATTSDAAGLVDSGSVTGYSDMDFNVRGPGIYHVSVRSNCPFSGCSLQSTTLAAYLTVGSTKMTGLTNQTAIAKDTLAPYRVTKAKDSWSATYRTSEDEGTVLQPAAYIVLEEKTKIYIKAEVTSNYGGEFKLLITKNGPATTKYMADHTIPSTSGTGGDWEDNKELPAGHWYIQPVVHETATGNAVTYTSLRFAVGIGDVPSSVTSLGPCFALLLAALSVFC
jgi:hypothetical protein